MSASNFVIAGLFVAGFFLGFVVWMLWITQTMPTRKRKNDEYHFDEEKPKHPIIIQAPKETFEHAQEVHWPTTFWIPDNSNEYQHFLKQLTIDHMTDYQSDDDDDWNDENDPDYLHDRKGDDW